jgi:AraC-like DNA-binding protein
MLSSRIIESSDPDEFVAKIRPSGLEILVTGRGRFLADGLLTEVGHFDLQQCRENLARIIRLSMPRLGIIFLSEPGPSMFLDGAELGPDSIALFSSSRTYLSRTTGPTSWSAMTLADDDIGAICRTKSVCSAASLSGCTIMQPLPRALVRLRALHAAAASWARSLPETELSACSAEGLEQALLRAMADCFETSAVTADTMAMQHHRLIIERFHTMLATHPSGPLFMPAVSHALGISGRTLRMACQEQLGVSPTQYLLLRRMRQARRILRKADPDETRVTDIATALGFWELGRFSVNYRAIFGESPSTTLRVQAPPGSLAEPQADYAAA